MQVPTEISDEFHNTNDVFVPYKNYSDGPKENKIKKIKKCPKVCLWGNPDEDDTDMLMQELKFAEEEKINRYIKMNNSHSQPLKVPDAEEDEKENCHRLIDGDVKKCLFGRPCQRDIENLLTDQINSDKSRFLELYGIDIDSLENLRTLTSTFTSRKRKLERSPRKSPATPSRRRCLFQSRKITDFFRQTKKGVPDQDKRT